MRTTTPLLFALLACTPDGSADVKGDRTDGPGPTSAETVALDEAIALDGLMGHLEALQAAAEAHDDTRAVGTPGFDASVDYAEQVLVDAGYTVTREPFQFTEWMPGGPTVLEVPSDPALAFASGSEIAAMTYSPGGSVTAPLHAVDLLLPPSENESSTSGCEADDFADFPVGAVALVQRGTCYFQDKADNAQAAGASAMILFNEGQPGRTELEPWQLSADGGTTIPVVSAAFSVGDALAAALEQGPVTVDLAVDAEVMELESVNVIAETAGGDPDQVLVVGGHLDSVPAGPGINDNGTGVAMILEMAVQVAAHELEPRNRIRFALWGAEEIGLLGSSAHVQDLGPDGQARVLANLNFDMVGSPNGSAMVYDGDGDDFGVPGPDGSDAIEGSFRDWFDATEQPVIATMFDGRSDYFEFILNGIPAGGLFSGAEGIKLGDEADLFGGQAGAPRDACYHQACDTIENLDTELFLTLSRAGAATTWDLANRDGLEGASVADRRPMPEVLEIPRGCQHDSAFR